MKNFVLKTAVSTALIACCAAATSASAVTRTRSDLQVAGGACQPFFATSQARYSASGLTNAGTATFYVACSMGGPYSGNVNAGNDRIGIYLYNPTGSSLTINCTARPGRLNGDSNLQGAAPRSMSVAAGASWYQEWRPADFSTTTIANPNFTCTLPVGVVMNWVFAEGEADVGA